MKVKRGDRTVFNYAGNTQYTIGEFWGNCDKEEFDLDTNLMMAVVAITIHYNLKPKKLTITSTYRSKSQSDAILASQGRAPIENDPHEKCKAIDFVFPRKDLYATFLSDLQSKGALYTLLTTQYKVRQILWEVGREHIHISTYGKPLIKKFGEVTGESIPTQIDEDKKKIAPVKEYYDYLHLDSAVKTIDGLIGVQNSIIANIDSQQSLLQYKGKNDKSNLDNLWELYTEDQKSKFSTQYKSLVDAKASASDKQNFKPTYVAGTDYEINVGTVLFIPKNKASIETLSAIGKDLFMVQQDLTAFLHDEFQALVTDPTYVPTEKVKIQGSKYSISYLNITFTCWIYIRAIDKILNVTPFVKSMETEVGDGGGSFNIELTDISNLEDLRKYSQTYYSYVYKVMNGKFNISFFKKLIQQNDIVFLRYEKLDVEGDVLAGNQVNLLLEDSILPGKIFDMIGLVDSTSEQYSAGSNTANISVNGRDFMKLLIEDGCYFFPFALTNGGKDFFLNYNPSDSVFKRMFVGGEFMNLFTALYRSIRDSLGFIFNQLTNTGVLPKDNDLFDAYKNSFNRLTGQNEDRQSKTYQVNGANKEYLDAVEQNGVWKIIKLIVDNQLDNRRMNNGELSTPEGSIIDLVRRICLDPFVEFWGDTMGDQYVFMVRQPPLTKQQIIDYFTREDNIVFKIGADQVSDVSLQWETTYSTWYQLQPLEGLFGSSQFIAGTRMPIVYFEEFAQLFGMHKRVVSDSYIPLGALTGDKQKTNIDIYRQALANDLKFLIESTALLPFTRRGSITLIGGDRRIKKGMWVEFEPTGEIFYVRSVHNHVSIMGDNLMRVTTLTVERGMIKQYVIGPSEQQINGKDINYFDMISMDVIIDNLNAHLTGALSQESQPQTIIPTKEQMKAVLGNAVPEDQYYKWFTPIQTGGSNKQLIDKDLFEFFSKRRQF